jgi:hypothetical protein
MKLPACSIAILTLAMILVRANAQSKNIHENVDPYTGLRTLFLELSTRTCPNDPPLREHDPDVHVLLTASENKSGVISYFLTPELDRGSPLNVRAKGTMDTLIDGVPGTLTTPMGGNVTTAYGGGSSFLHETVPFAILQSDLARLSATNWFQFRVNGLHLAVQRCIDAKHLRDLPEFLAAAQDYATPQSASAQQPQPSDPQPEPQPDQTSPSARPRELKLANIPTQPCPGDSAPPSVDVHLIVSAAPHGDGVWYFLTTDLTHGPLLNLHRGDTIQTQMGARSGIFNTINGSVVSTRSDANGQPTHHETIAFHVHQKNLIELSEAPAFKFQIVTPKQTVQRCVDPKDLSGLPQFLASSNTLSKAPAPDAAKP